MVDLKLPKLPDRAPVKVIISVPPELHLMLADYVAIYREAYGQEETLCDLIPYMLKAFLESDRKFAKAREALSHASKRHA